MYYLIEYNSNIIGAYTEYNTALHYILSCYQNKFMTMAAYIVSCHKDTCFFKTKNKIELVVDANQTTTQPSMPQTTTQPTPQMLISKADTKQLTLTQKNNNLFITPEYQEAVENKCKLQHEINLLKCQKNKIEQSKNVYENDIKLYNMFKKSAEESPSFVIPEIFVKKYDIFKKLESENKLSWENFVDEYKNENMYNDHFNVTYHEEKYSNNVIQEFDISSDYVSSDEEMNN